MNPLSSELPFHVHNWLISSLKDFSIVIRKWPTCISITGSPEINFYFNSQNSVAVLSDLTGKDDVFL